MKRRRGPGEGSITQRKDGRWQVRVDLGRDELGKRRRKYLYADSQAEAVRLLRRAQRDKERGRLSVVNAAAPKNLAAWLDTWLETVRVNKEPLTYRGYEMIVRVHLKPALGYRRLSNLQPLDIQRFLDAKRGSLAPGTVRRIWVVLTSALTRAERLGLMPRNPSSSRIIEVPEFDSAPENILSLAEARAFLASIREDRLYALYLTAVVLGQRQSSLLGLRWSDVDDQTGRLRLPMRLVRFERAWQLRSARTRTKKTARNLPLPAPVAVALREHRVRQQREREAAGSEWSVMEHKGRDVELVFTNPVGRPLHGRDVTERFQKRLAEAGLDRRRFHDLRHSAASVMIALKIPLKVVSEVLAHSGIQITADLYGHLEDDVLRAQLAILDAAWAEEGIQVDDDESSRR